MQVCTSLHTDNHASTPPLSFLQAGCPSCRPTNSIKALMAPVNNCTAKVLLQQLGHDSKAAWWWRGVWCRRWAYQQSYSTSNILVLMFWWTAVMHLSSWPEVCYDQCPITSRCPRNLKMTTMILSGLVSAGMLTIFTLAHHLGIKKPPKPIQPSVHHGQSTVMLCSWGVTAGVAHSNCR